ncbi:FAD-dependent monooxygenase [Agromyces aerolatus]|uniref:FAD-dependent monooxygenase n=1 Tax=Agromyces sp. LY-1074 TaxID=3074080 RepID=UPI00285BE89D|nr:MULTISPECIES: FAD-dependent monooxygenase [unclassified Agromyces]MDR5701896.1 FAD-dependent monooxygenase [Agromyces sp. LY-1074]MDR5708136.1 FAD-dependent monooxygenase [Agromyces sp. LY-1358]
MSDQTISTDVLIVGAGPTGLMLAACLARLGVAAEIVDAKAGPTRESRALVVQARTLEVYDQLGIAGRAIAEGHPIEAVVPGAGARPFGRFGFGRAGARVSAFAEVLGLEQSRNEAMLADLIVAEGRSIRWRHRLTGLRLLGEGSDEIAADAAGAARAAGAIATLEGPEGTVTIRARYCVGADGAHSPVREALAVPFTGRTNPLTYFVADAVGATGYVPDAVNLRVAEDDLLLAFPMGDDGRVRLLGLVRDRDLAADGTVSEADTRERLERTFGVTYRDRTWFATYRVHHRLAERFRVGPCFLAGDAAHIHSPVGGQGMNTGLQEAHDLACALADVLIGGMPDARLDRYEAERRPVGRTLVETTDRIFAAITSESRRARFVRGRLFPALGPLLIRVVPWLVGGRRLFGYLSQTRIRYRMTPPGGAAAQTPADDLVGRRLPWSGENRVALRAFTWQVHGYGAPASLVHRLARDLRIDGHTFPPDVHGVLRADRVYLVRRDGFVAAVATADPERRGVPLTFLEQLAG